MVQRALARLYEVEVPHRVDDFLITDRALARRMEGAQHRRDAPEKLLIAQADDTVDLALYLDRDLMDFLSRHDPTEALHEGNIAQFWSALEGISHFLYVAWNALHDRSVTLLELELQAEVDKYIGAVMLFLEQRAGHLPRGLHERLFGRPSYDDQLDHTEYCRYWTANHYASRYCRQLHERLLARRHGNSVINDLRRFYRLTQRDKIRHIAALQFRGSYT